MKNVGEHEFTLGIPAARFEPPGTPPSGGVITTEERSAYGGRVADPGEEERFEDIVERLQVSDPHFGENRRRGRWTLIVGVALCVGAVALIALGGVEGAVLAFVPWIVGLVLVVRSRSWH
jgi:hypothetical protein